MKDYLHNLCWPSLRQYNYAGDILILSNFFLAALALPYLNYNASKKAVYLGIAFYSLRELLSIITYCETAACKEHRPWFGGDTRWYVISGHLLASSLITYALVQSDVSDLLKDFSTAITMMVFATQIATREHYTTDMVLTAVMVYLALKCYG
jgi:hypothetical protein